MINGQLEEQYETFFYFLATHNGKLKKPCPCYASNLPETPHLRLLSEETRSLVSFIKDPLCKNKISKCNNSINVDVVAFITEAFLQVPVEQLFTYLHSLDDYINVTELLLLTKSVRLLDYLRYISLYTLYNAKLDVKKILLWLASLPSIDSRQSLLNEVLSQLYILSSHEFQTYINQNLNDTDSSVLYFTSFLLSKRANTIEDLNTSLMALESRLSVNSIVMIIIELVKLGFATVLSKSSFIRSYLIAVIQTDSYPLEFKYNTYLLLIELYPSELLVLTSGDFFSSFTDIIPLIIVALNANESETLYNLFDRFVSNVSLDDNLCDVMSGYYYSGKIVLSVSHADYFTGKLSNLLQSNSVNMQLILSIVILLTCNYNKSLNGDLLLSYLDYFVAQRKLIESAGLLNTYVVTLVLFINKWLLHDVHLFMFADALKSKRNDFFKGHKLAKCIMNDHVLKVLNKTLIFCMKHRNLFSESQLDLLSVFLGKPSDCFLLDSVNRNDVSESLVEQYLTLNNNLSFTDYSKINDCNILIKNLEETYANFSSSLLSIQNSSNLSLYSMIAGTCENSIRFFQEFSKIAVSFYKSLATVDVEAVPELFDNFTRILIQLLLNNQLIDLLSLVVSGRQAVPEEARTYVAQVCSAIPLYSALLIRNPSKKYMNLWTYAVLIPILGHFKRFLDRLATIYENSLDSFCVLQLSTALDSLLSSFSRCSFDSFYFSLIKPSLRRVAQVAEKQKTKANYLASISKYGGVTDGHDELAAYIVKYCGYISRKVDSGRELQSTKKQIKFIKS